MQVQCCRVTTADDCSHNNPCPTSKWLHTWLDALRIETVADALMTYIYDLNISVIIISVTYICSLISHEIDRLYVTELLSSQGICLLERPNESPLVFLFFERESPLVNHSYEKGFKNTINLWLHYLHNPFFNYVLINIFLLHRKRRVDRFDYQFHSQALTLKN